MFLAAQAGAASSQRWLFVCGVLHRLAGESRRKRFKSPSFWERSTKADEDVLQTLLLLETFFNGSAEQIVAALLDVSAARLTNEELDRLAELIEKAKREGK